MLPDLGRLPLARDDVDRGTELRDDETWLTTLWDRPNTRVLWLHGRTAPIYAGQIVLAAATGDLPDDAVYLAGQPIIEPSTANLSNPLPNTWKSFCSLPNHRSRPQSWLTHRWEASMSSMPTTSIGSGCLI